MTGDRSRRGSRHEIARRRRALDLPSLEQRDRHHPLGEAAEPGLDMEPGAVPDPAGRIAHPAARAVDVLEALHRRGTLADEQLAAGRQFEADFERAALDAMPACDPARAAMGGGPPRRRKAGGARPVEMAEATRAARDRVWRALEAVGGAASPPGMALWHVAGEGQPVKILAQRLQSSGRAGGNPLLATGVLIAALTALAAHYGGPRRR